MNQYNLQRFLDAQSFDFARALSEIESGKKTSHWIWYIFPQLKGLGRSRNCKYYGIDGLEEAKLYVQHPILLQRLTIITEALLKVEGKSAVQILGGIDAVKVCSCMTLFDVVIPNSVFDQVLEKYYGGKRDEQTINLLKNDEH